MAVRGTTISSSRNTGVYIILRTVPANRATMVAPLSPCLFHRTPRRAEPRRCGASDPATVTTPVPVCPRGYAPDSGPHQLSFFPLPLCSRAGYRQKDAKGRQRAGGEPQPTPFLAALSMCCVLLPRPILCWTATAETSLPRQVKKTDIVKINCTVPRCRTIAPADSRLPLPVMSARCGTRLHVS